MKKQIALFSILGLFFSFKTAKACTWEEYPEIYRLALFRAGVKEMSVFQPFIYSAEHHFNSPSSDPERLDKKRNCKEWQAKIGANVSTEDIDEILYSTRLEPLQSAYFDGNLQATFAENSFIQALILPKNRDLLQYLLFAKEMEYEYVLTQNAYNEGFKRWEDWENVNGYAEIIPSVSSKCDSIFCELPNIKDNFLRMRYAFLLLRDKKGTCGNKDRQILLDAIFQNSISNSIVQDWAVEFKEAPKNAASEEAGANYMYSLCFDRCNEKKFCSVFGFHKETKFIRQTLSLAQNPREKGIIKLMTIINKDNPQLQNIQEIAALLPNTHYLAFLIAREMNKLEDWIFTPKFTNYPPSTFPDRRDNDDWYKFREATIRKNLQKDMAYLREFKAFLQKIYPKSEGEMHDFLAVSIAHLCFINDELAEGNQYLAQISANANPNILAQKNIDLTLNLLKSEDVSKPETKDKIFSLLNELDKKCLNHFEMNKNLYSLLRAVCHEYEEKQDFATAGLLFMKSEHYKRVYEQKWYNYNSDYESEMNQERPDDYMRIGYFDRYANVKDMDNLLNMLQKKQKTNFEKYLSKQPLADLNFYKDLKGTMAFRNDNLELAYKTFAQIPDSFWRKKYYYKDILNENPFVPKVWAYTQKRDFSFVFNKAKFVGELIRLKQQVEQNPAQKAENYLLLGHAYYNCSYHGNSWLMCEYSKSISSIFYQIEKDDIFGDLGKVRKDSPNKNYISCSLSKEYYQKALQFAQNDEQKAMANFMIHVCDYHAFLNEKQIHNKYKANQSLKDFYGKYQNTDVFRQFECPLMESFL